MKIGNKAILHIILLLIPLLITSQAYAGRTINLRVRTILASHKQGPDDPRLGDLTQQLQSVFRYSSYKLLKLDRMVLNQQPASRISLPGNRIMSITATGISGNRAILKIEIFRKKRPMFQTIIQLRNNSSVTIGGPKHKKGDLLFNIFSSF